jgi:hypothetical protein
MKGFRLSVLTLVVVFASNLQGQVISSESSSIKVNNVSQQETADNMIKSPPEIKFIAPSLMPGTPFKTESNRLSLIGKATDEEGIASVIVNSRMEEYTEAGVFTASLLLEPGENEIKVVVMDGGDNLTEKTYIIEYVPLVLSFAEKISQEAKYYGLIIGVNNYIDRDIQDLDNPIKNAKSLYNVLLEHYTFEEENVTFIKDASREDIITALDELSEIITPNDNLLIFYAGHGWWDQEANNGYWLPTDAADDKKTDWFRNSALVDYLKEVKSKHTLLITDACFGGAIFKTRSAFSDAPKSIEMLYELKSRKAMTSGTLTEVPDESAFSKYLVERLEQNEEKYLNSEQLFSSFRTAVINNSEALPQYGEIRNVGDEGGDFIFIKK